MFVTVCVNKASVAPPFVCADCNDGISECVPVTQMDKCMHISSVAHKFTARLTNAPHRTHRGASRDARRLIDFSFSGEVLMESAHSEERAVGEEILQGCL